MKTVQVFFLALVLTSCGRERLKIGRAVSDSTPVVPANTNFPNFHPNQPPPATSQVAPQITVVVTPPSVPPQIQKQPVPQPQPQPAPQPQPQPQPPPPPPRLRAGCYRIGGGGFYSNGNGASCTTCPALIIHHCGMSMEYFWNMIEFGDHQGNEHQGWCAGCPG